MAQMLHGLEGKRVSINKGHYTGIVGECNLKVRHTYVILKDCTVQMGDKEAKHAEFYLQFPYITQLTIL